MLLRTSHAILSVGSFAKSFVLLALLSYASIVTAADARVESKPQSRTPQYIFGWQFVDPSQASLTPRGGTSTGPAVEVVSEPDARWLAIQEKDISSFERDRRAILAMVGEYRVSFDFLETEGYSAGFTPAAPYRSWGTEFVKVVEDRGDFIALQHLMVMYFEDEQGNISDPMVMKHWRQDWQYQDRKIFAYKGHRQWGSQKISRKARKKTWSQSVYQVDDSPRYASYGKWTHNGSFSSWEGKSTWRPLPRREKTVRNDYQVLLGHNRQTVTPTGWIHEEDNFKMVIDSEGNIDAQQPYLAKEIGIARYDRITGHNFAPGYTYLEATSKFWSQVRAYWREIEEDAKDQRILSSIDRMPMFMPMFMRAQAIAEGESFTAEENRIWLEETLKPFLAD